MEWTEVQHVIENEFRKGGYQVVSDGFYKEVGGGVTLVVSRISDSQFFNADIEVHMTLSVAYSQLEKSFRITMPNSILALEEVLFQLEEQVGRIHQTKSEQSVCCELAREGWGIEFHQVVPLYRQFPYWYEGRVVTLVRGNTRIEVGVKGELEWRYDRFRTTLTANSLPAETPWFVADATILSAFQQGALHMIQDSGWIVNWYQSGKWTKEEVSDSLFLEETLRQLLSPQAE